MILIASTSKPLSYTTKGTLRRGAILRDYAQEIDAIYKAVEESSSTNVPVPNGSSSEGGWTIDESLQFVHDVIHCIMKGAEAMGDDDDIFGFGCDRYFFFDNSLLYESSHDYYKLFPAYKQLTYVTP